MTRTPDNRAAPAAVAGECAGPEPLRLRDCTILAIAELHDELLGRLAGCGTVQIDRSEVQRPNTALLQLLMAFVRDLRAQSRAVEWVGASGPFDRSARFLGCTAALGLPAGEG